MVSPRRIIVVPPYGHSRVPSGPSARAVEENSRASANTALQNVTPLLLSVVRVVEGLAAHGAGRCTGRSFRHVLGHDEGSTSAGALHHGEAALRFQGDQLD